MLLDIWELETLYIVCLCGIVVATMFLKPRPTRTVTVLEVERLEIQVEQLQKRQDSDR